MIVVKFWTSRANASPTRPRMVEASVDNLAPTAPLYSPASFELESQEISVLSYMSFYLTDLEFSG